MKTKLTSALLLFPLLTVGIGTAARAADVNALMNADRAAGLRVIAGPVSPFSVKSVSAEYDLRGISLAPGQVIYLSVPANLAAGVVEFISFSHRQDPDDENECTPGPSGRDCRPAYDSLEVFNEFGSGGEQGWRVWGGVSSGPGHSKFAEVRGRTPETDNLYEWLKHGTVGLDGRRSKAPVKASVIRIRGVGEDNSLIHRVILKVVPPPPTKQVVTVFSDGLDFGDFATSRGRHFPNRPGDGDYGNALDLGRGSTRRHPALPADWSIGRNGIEIPLVAGLRLVSVEAAIGDMTQIVPRGEDPEKYRGNAVLSMEIRHADGSEELIMKKENIGESGVLRASPADTNAIIKAGDRLRVTVPRGTAHLMGLRLGYAD